MKNTHIKKLTNNKMECKRLKQMEIENKYDYIYAY